MNTANFDWLSDLTPLFKAQESWFDGSYQRITNLQVMSGTETPFSISCGAGLLAEHISRFRFTPALIQRLGQVTDPRGRSVFHESFLNHLQRLRLRINVQTAAEGTLILPGEPLIIVQGPWIQALLLESAFHLMIWESSHWATQAALLNWEKKQISEEITPAPPAYTFNPAGWKKRALYIGGNENGGDKQAAPWPGMSQVLHDNEQPIRQIRRLFQGDHPLGDVWLTQSQENQASVSRTHIDFKDNISGSQNTVQMSRFQNLYQAVLLKGHPILTGSSLDYLRQRTWKQLEAFGQINLAEYPRGWYQEA